MRVSFRVVGSVSTGLTLLCATLLAAQHGRLPMTIRRSDTSPPTLGNYPDTSIPLSTSPTIIPDAAPTNTTSVNVSTSSNFNGTLAGDPASGVLRVTDAH